MLYKCGFINNDKLKDIISILLFTEYLQEIQM